MYQSNNPDNATSFVMGSPGREYVTVDVDVRSLKVYEFLLNLSPIVLVERPVGIQVPHVESGGKRFIGVSLSKAQYRRGG
jgi:hypothetical protein